MGLKEKRRPFIKKFKTDHCYYVYDVNSNELIRVDPIIYDLIDFINELDEDRIIESLKHNYDPDAISKSFDQVIDARDKHGYFSSHRPSIFCGFRSADDFKPILQTSLSQLVLELTEKCNLRCGYCIFSGRYTDNRSHGDRDMAKETALRAVDFFTERSWKPDKGDLPAITFYGGEPLLKFNLIDDVVRHIEEMGLGDKYRFSFTTNGTLLTKDIIRRLVEYNISIVISLDGPKQIHDKYRKFSNESGTFDSIVKNLKYISDSYPEYFKENIAFAPVVAPPYDFDAIIRFFYKQKFLEPLRDKLILNFVDTYNTSFFREFHLEEEQAKLKPGLKQLKTRYSNALACGTYDNLTIEKQLFLNAFHTISCRRIEKLGEYHPAIGSCIPGQRRLFVDTIGDFFMCERVGSNYSIGNVRQGIDFKKIYDFYTQYDHFFKDCSNCWALRLCRKCFNDIRKGENFDEKRKEKMCTRRLEEIESNLITYARTLERNRDAFKVFEEITVT